jgi:hypothetical protein
MSEIKNPFGKYLGYARTLTPAFRITIITHVLGIHFVMPVACLKDVYSLLPRQPLLPWQHGPSALGTHAALD